MDSSLEFKSKKKVTYSTPIHNAIEMRCTLSSISGSSSSSSSTKSRGIASSKHTIININNETVSVERNPDHEKESNRIIEDPIREVIFLPDIRPNELEPLFSRPKIAEPSADKTIDELIELPILSKPEKSSSSTGDSLLTEKVGEHYYTYEGKPCHEVATTPIKINPYLNRKANLLWEDFIKDKPPVVIHKKRKHVNCFRTENKFFKSKRNRLEDGRNVKDSVPEKKKKVNIGWNVAGMSTPSLTRPLGWMAILGIGIAERLEVCNEDIYSFRQHKFRSNGRRNYISEEYPSPTSSKDAQEESDEYPSPTRSKNAQNESDEYPSPTRSKNTQYESDEYPSPTPIINKKKTSNNE
ncbi:hypothetical protein PV326_010720 [Microctonus aethiopoides]|nr:hypothetical protein PV326_010720 [Microctonus aethiopoides]